MFFSASDAIILVLKRGEGGKSFFSLYLFILLNSILWRVSQTNLKSCFLYLLKRTWWWNE